MIVFCTYIIHIVTWIIGKLHGHNRWCYEIWLFLGIILSVVMLFVGDSAGVDLSKEFVISRIIITTLCVLILINRVFILNCQTESYRAGADDRRERQERVREKRIREQEEFERYKAESEKKEMERKQIEAAKQQQKKEERIKYLIHEIDMYEEGIKKHYNKEFGYGLIDPKVSRDAINKMKDELKRLGAYH